MKLLSLNVGLPREVPWQGRVVATGIFKDATGSRLQVRRDGVEGDGQADRSVHGGEHKAVYAYPVEHYAYWSERFAGRALSHGMFGENLTTEGLFEQEVFIGNRYRIGDVVLAVSEPRMPCFKLGIRFGDAGVVKQFLEARRPGVYFSVVDEGELGAGDAIEQVSEDPRRVSVVDLALMYRAPEVDRGLLERALQIPALGGSWRQSLEALQAKGA